MGEEAVAARVGGRVEDATALIIQYFRPSFRESIRPEHT